MNARVVGALLTVFGLASAAITGTPIAASPGKAPAEQDSARVSFPDLPLSFEINRGQSDPRVKFLARGSGYGLFLTASEAVLALRARPEAGGPQSDMLRMKLLGARTGVRVTGGEPLPGKVNYLRGRNPKEWRTGIPTFGKVRYHSVYPGVDLVYYGRQGHLEYDFVVEPGADPKQIGLKFEGIRGTRLDRTGDLLLPIAGGEVRWRKPVSYQEIDGRRRIVPSRYVLNPDGRIGFKVARYDATRPLVIDPVLVYSTFVGGTQDTIGCGADMEPCPPDTGGGAGNGGKQKGNNGVGNGEDPPPPGNPPVNDGPGTGPGNPGNKGGANRRTASVRSTSVRSASNSSSTTHTHAVYATGPTFAADFPTTAGAVQRTFRGGEEVFVTKINETGTAVIYSTFIGGSGNELSTGMAVDGAGNAYVIGGTDSPDFPTTPGAYQQAGLGGLEAFVFKLNSSGSALVYSTLLTGAANERADAIAVGSGGRVYVGGSTRSASFPTVPGAHQSVHGGLADAFLVCLNPTGSGLERATLLGGSGVEAIKGIARDSSGNVFVTGLTDSPNLPTLGAFQPVYGGGGDAFVAKLTGDLALLFSSYLGGTANDNGQGIATDSGGNAYAVGGTYSTDFPITAGAAQGVHGGARDAFVARVSPTGALLSSTYLGGAGFDLAMGVAVAASGQVFVTGGGQAGFPVTAGALQTVNGGADDVFLAILNASGSAVMYCTCLGGAGQDTAVAVRVDSLGSAHLVGFTGSANYPTRGAIQSTLGAPMGAFVTKIGDARVAPCVPGSGSGNDDKQKGNNGVGNGEDPPPPGNPPVNDGPGTGPGNPGKGGKKKK